MRGLAGCMMGAAIMRRIVAELAVRGWDSRREAAAATFSSVRRSKGRRRRGGLYVCNVRRTDVENPPGVEGDALVFELGRRMAKAKVADRPQATREDVAKVAFDESGAF